MKHDVPTRDSYVWRIKWVDCLAYLFLAFVGIAGYLTVYRVSPVPDSLILALIGLGVISSALLINANKPSIEIVDKSPK